jgi:uncharacterized protein (TIGR02452 family)
MMDRRIKNAEIFSDTERRYKTEHALIEAVKQSRSAQQFISAGDSVDVPESGRTENARVTVSGKRSLEAAESYAKQDKRVCVHNFASATNPGGGVVHGSSAQEEAICRCSTLYPVLNTKENWSRFYKFHRDRHDAKYTDTCIYTHDILIIKSDTDVPRRLSEDKWCKVDVITCAAPNLRERPGNAMNPSPGNQVHLSDKELMALHEKRGRHLLAAAAEQKAEIMILGAFGCGAFQNDPKVVAEAYKKILAEFDGVFREVHFAVFCSPRDTGNFDAFKKVLG